MLSRSHFRSNLPQTHPRPCTTSAFFPSVWNLTHRCCNFAEHATGPKPGIVGNVFVPSYRLDSLLAHTSNPSTKHRFQFPTPIIRRQSFPASSANKPPSAASSPARLHKPHTQRLLSMQCAENSSNTASPHSASGKVSGFAAFLNPVIATNDVTSL